MTVIEDWTVNLSGGRTLTFKEDDTLTHAEARTMGAALALGMRVLPRGGFCEDLDADYDAEPGALRFLVFQDGAPIGAWALVCHEVIDDTGNICKANARLWPGLIEATRDQFWTSEVLAEIAKRLVQGPLNFSGVPGKRLQYLDLIHSYDLGRLGEAPEFAAVLAGFPAQMGAGNSEYVHADAQINGRTHRTHRVRLK